MNDEKDVHLPDIEVRVEPSKETSVVSLTTEIIEEEPIDNLDKPPVENNPKDQVFRLEEGDHGIHGEPDATVKHDPKDDAFRLEEGQGGNQGETAEDASPKGKKVRFQEDESDDSDGSGQIEESTSWNIDEQLRDTFVHYQNVVTQKLAEMHKDTDDLCGLEGSDVDEVIEKSGLREIDQQLKETFAGYQNALSERLEDLWTAQDSGERLFFPEAFEDDSSHSDSTTIPTISTHSLPFWRRRYAPSHAFIRRGQGQNLQKGENKWLMRMVICVALTLIVCMGATFALVFFFKQPDQQVSEEELGKAIGNAIASAQSSAFPTLEPVNATTAPVDSRYLYLESLPNYTLESIAVPKSPQNRAYRYLEEHQNHAALPVWKQRQVFAMVTLFYALDGRWWPTPVRTDWLDFTKSECDWFSSANKRFDNANGDGELLPCNEDQEFQSLDLSQIDFSALPKPYLPPEISLLTSLRRIYLIDSSIKAELSAFFPAELAQLSVLGQINLSQNSLFGTVPTQIGLVKSLTALEIDNVQAEHDLTGTLPSQLGILTALTRLSIKGSAFTGALPTQLGLMTALQGGLDLADNLFASTIPSELGRLSILENLVLENNKLVGVIPSQLGLLSSLEVFSLGENLLTGSIASQLGMLSRLLTFNLHGNKLGGPVPSELGRVEVKDFRPLKMDLSSNLLSGELPASVLFQSWGSSIDLRGNMLSGSIPDPPESQNFTAEHLLLGNNSFTGTISPALFQVQFLDLSNLLLSGSIPEIVDGPLRHLDIRGNENLTGTIPESLCALNDGSYSKLRPSAFTGMERKYSFEFDCTNSFCGCGCECTASPATDSSLSLLKGGKKRHHFRLHR